MMNRLTFHNIRIAWRNLMKYKAQNTIAVLCLAVGLVFFSLTVIWTQRMWQSWKREVGDPRRAKMSLYTQQDSLAYIEPDIVQRIADAHLPSIEFIDINNWAIGTTSTFIDHEGKRHHIRTYWQWISPEHLHYLGLRSAITGKRIPVLKPGDMIMTRGMLARSFGLDVNPTGFTVDWGNRYSHPNSDSTHNAVIDVVDTGDWQLNEDHMLVVTDRLKEFAPKSEGEKSATYLHSVDIILAKGKKDTDLQHDLQELLPEYKVKVNIPYYRLLTQGVILMVFLGSSILLIGLFGFLKTQIQLFRLRQREIALRQCMGAQREQLFGLIMWEVAIVFFFVTLTALGLTALFAEYGIPIMKNEMSSNTSELLIDMQRTYATELWICLGVFLVTAGIAALSVRRVITAPLCEVVGKSRRISTRGRSLLIVLQMVICQVLVFFFISGVTLANISEEYDTPDNEDALRSCIVTNNENWVPEFLDTLQHMQHMEGVTHVAATFYKESLKEGEEPQDPYGVYTDENGQRWCKHGLVLTDEHFFDLIGKELLPPDTTEMLYKKGIIPVYDYRNKDKSQPAEKIGYAEAKQLVPLTYGQMPEAFYVCETAFFLEHKDLILRVWDEFGDAFKNWGGEHSIIFRAKPGEYKAAVRELTEFYHGQGWFTSVKAPLDNLYEKCYSEQRMVELMGIITLIMLFVAVLCIVLTLFSSVSLDTRGRQKEVAIRKAHGAGTRQILWLFGRQYVWQLVASGLISFVISMGVSHWFFGRETATDLIMPSLYAILFIAFLTLLTVGYKIHKVSKLNPATIIKKE
jgi:ABC-type lipoprotein release transport system permease subunit